MIAHYTTDVSSEKSAEEARRLLRAWGANNIMEIIDQHREIVGLRFVIDNVAYQLDTRADIMLTKMKSDRSVPSRYCNKAQAARVAWRILLNWLKYQIEAVKSGMFEREEVLMPYSLVGTGQTRWQVYRQQELLEEKV